MICQIFEMRRTLLLFLSSVIGLSLAAPAFSADAKSWLAAGAGAVEYATNTVKPALDSCHNGVSGVRGHTYTPDRPGTSKQNRSSESEEMN